MPAQRFVMDPEIGGGVTTGWPDSIARRTPRWISSSGYFRGRGI
jgi:hypothetical protein